MALSSKKSAPSLPTKIDVVSNVDKGRVVSILGGFIELSYYESILQDSIKVSYFYADAGSSIDGKSVVEGLPMIGTEDVQLVIEDNNQSKIKVDLNVNSINPAYEDSTKSITRLSLVSEQFIRNEEGSARIMERYDGNISENVKRILKDKLKAKSGKKLKEKNIEDTANDYNFFGNGRKPYYMLNYLSKASVPSTQNSDGNTAGYFFYETSKGYNFKSIDSLLSQKKKKSIIYNETPDNGGEDIPEGYDMKALQFEKENAVNVQNKLRMGAYSTRTVVFNPFNCKYEVLNKEAKEVEKKEGIQTAGERLPVFNKEFDQEGKEKEFSRTMYMLLDTGSLPSGDAEKPVAASDQQLEKCESQNYQPAKILAQSVMRYNQLFAALNTITIAGDFSLHAGDAIFVDAPDLQTDTSNDEVNKESGGLYIIADLCHYITPKETYTKLNLVRDTFGRKCKPTSSQQSGSGSQSEDVLLF